MNSENSDSRRLLLNLPDKINLKKSQKCVALSNLSIYYTRKNLKSHTKTINVKYQLQCSMINMNYPTDYILYQIFTIILNISSKTWRTECQFSSKNMCKNRK